MFTREMTMRFNRSIRLAMAGCVLVIAVALVRAAQQSTGGRAPSGAPSAAADGKTLYELRCANCHGVAGKGDGPAAGMLVVRPRDFTSGRFKLLSTESGSVPTDDDLARTISSGMHGTSMPEWRPFLSEQQVRAIVGYVKTFSPRFASERPQPVSVGSPIPSSVQSVERGRLAYERLKCAACHGTDGEGRGAISTDLEDSWGRPIAATRLTEPWAFRGGASAADVYLRFRTGMIGTPMPSFKDAATDDEMWHLANYVVSLARKPVWEMTGPEAQTFYRGLDEKVDKRERGRYLIETLGCAFCHSPIKDDGTIIEEFRLAGGQRISTYPFPEFVTYNLTSDKDTGLGAWTDDQIRAVLTRGTRPDGSRMLPFPMPWTSYGSLKPADLDAIVVALRALPPVSNAIPSPDEFSFVPYLWGKFQLLILHRDLPGATYPGNAGTPGRGRSWQTVAR